MPSPLPERAKALVLIAALLAVFLGALDALIVGAAMPTIVADLGGLELYSWVFSAYMLARAVSLPLFGKLADLYSTKRLFILALGIFLIGSVPAGAVRNMGELILLRAVQGVGAGGNFALAYIVVAEVSPPAERGRTMGLISFVWGISSLLGPLLGGLIVTYLPWPWVFYLNVPLGALAIWWVSRYFRESREKPAKATVDYLGAFALTAGILSLLMAFLIGGKTSGGWQKPEVVGLGVLTVVAFLLFYVAERRAADPILPLGFFRVPGFTLANGAAFFSSFAIFSLTAFMPLFLQGAMGKTPAELGVLMVPLSLGWSAGALTCGRLVARLGEKPASLAGSLLMGGGTALTLTFGATTGLLYFSTVVFGTGVGMGFISLSTLLTVQNSLTEMDLGVATSSHQFARNLGGTIGVGVCGSLVVHKMDEAMTSLMNSSLGANFPPELATRVATDIQNALRSEFTMSLSGPAMTALRTAIGKGVQVVFWTSLLVCFISLIFCIMLPRTERRRA
ncbi:MAG TPA: MDR family MFS transporter [Syntrophobacteria bacterium]|nr:MDR family MFS transporter [Syntrophobacteria bacterium]